MISKPFYVHVYGPDDIHEFDTLLEALEFANDVNKSTVIWRNGAMKEKLEHAPFVLAAVYSCDEQQG